MFLQIVDIFKNKRNRKQQKYYVYLTKLITHDEISPFDGSLYNLYEFEYFMCKYVRIKYKIGGLAEVEYASFFLVR